MIEVRGQCLVANGVTDPWRAHATGQCKHSPTIEWTMSRSRCGRQGRDAIGQPSSATANACVRTNIVIGTSSQCWSLSITPVGFSINQSGVAHRRRQTGHLLWHCSTLSVSSALTFSQHPRRACWTDSPGIQRTNTSLLV